MNRFKSLSSCNRGRLCVAPVEPTTSVTRARSHCRALRAQFRQQQGVVEVPTSLGIEEHELIDAAVTRTIKMFHPEAASLKQLGDLSIPSSSCEAQPVVTTNIENDSRQEAIKHALGALQSTQKLCNLCIEAHLPEHIRVQAQHLLTSNQQLLVLLNGLQQEQEAVDVTEAVRSAVEVAANCLPLGRSLLPSLLPTRLETVDTVPVVTADGTAVETAGPSVSSSTLRLPTSCIAVGGVRSHPIVLDDSIDTELLEPPQQLARVLSGVATNCGKRRYMEDAYTFCSLHPELGALPVAQHDSSSGSTFMAGVFDGHGGSSTSEFAAAQLPTVLHNHLYNSRTADVDHQLAFPKAFAQLDQMCGWEGQPNGSGSTATVALVRKNQLVVGNAGDSVAILCRGGKARRISVAHNLKNPDEVARIAAAGCQLVETSAGVHRLLQNPVRVQRYVGSLSLSVTRGFGDFGFKGVGGDLVVSTPHVAELQLTPDDQLLLLTSDGITDVMSDQEMIQVAINAVDKAKQEGVTMSQLAGIAAATVKDKALQDGASDNVTVMALLLDWDAGF